MPNPEFTESDGGADRSAGEPVPMAFCWIRSAPRERLDQHLHELLPLLTRSAIQRMIAQGDITVDGRPVKPAHPPRRSERIEVRFPPPRPAEVHPEALPLAVLYEDADLLVINKPPGLVVHPAAGHEDGTLVNALLHHCQGQLSGIGGVARPGIVHRLDQDTSGCLVVAKNDHAHLDLAQQFHERQIEKIYHALLCGLLEPSAGEIQAAIARHPSHRKRMAATNGQGRPAWTSYRVLDYLRQSTLVEARLRTGRTHQIRVHFQFLGHPVVGDLLYGQRPNERMTQVTDYRAPRQMLHAYRLAFHHPRTRRLISLAAPWPTDFHRAVQALQARRLQGAARR